MEKRGEYVGLQIKTMWGEYVGMQMENEYERSYIGLQMENVLNV
jgi:hypothetical protein